MVGALSLKEACSLLGLGLGYPNSNPKFLLTTTGTGVSDPQKRTHHSILVFVDTAGSGVSDPQKRSACTALLLQWRSTRGTPPPCFCLNDLSLPLDALTLTLILTRRINNGMAFVVSLLVLVDNSVVAGLSWWCCCCCWLIVVLLWLLVDCRVG